MAPKREGVAYKCHNSIALLSATDRGEGFEEIINYLVRSPIAYSLRVDPDLRRDLISDFWTNASIVKTDTSTSIKTTVGGKHLILTEDIVRAVMQFQDHIDADDTMDELVIFGCFRQMGYSGRLDSIQFKKPYMPVLYRFLMHTVIMCLSPWKGGYDALDRRGQALMVSLVFNHPYNYSRFIFNNMVANVKDKTKTFDRYPRFVQLFIDQGLPNLPYTGLVEKALRIDSRYFMDCKRNSVELPLQGALLDSAYQAPDIHAYDHLRVEESRLKEPVQVILPSQPQRTFRSKNASEVDIQPPPLTQSPPPSSTKRTRTITSPPESSPKVPLKKKQKTTTTATSPKIQTIKPPTPTKPQPITSPIITSSSSQPADIEGLSDIVNQLVQQVASLQSSSRDYESRIKTLECQVQARDEIIARQECDIKNLQAKIKDDLEHEIEAKIARCDTMLERLDTLEDTLEDTFGIATTKSNEQDSEEKEEKDDDDDKDDKDDESKPDDDQGGAGALSNKSTEGQGAEGPSEPQGESALGSAKDKGSPAKGELSNPNLAFVLVTAGTHDQPQQAAQPTMSIQASTAVIPRFGDTQLLDRKETRSNTINQCKKSNFEKAHDNFPHQSSLSTKELSKKKLVEDLSDSGHYIPYTITRQRRGTRSNMNQDRKLNSDKVHSYLENLWRNFPEDKKSSFTHLDPLWYTLYSNDSNKERVLNWIQKKDVFSRKYVIFPIVQWGHWNVLIFCHFGETIGSKDKSPCILLLDSLEKTEHSKQLEPVIRKFVSDIYKKLEMTEDIKTLRKIPFLVPKVPQQRDDEECGFFVLYYIKLFVENAPESFDISDGYPFFMKKDWFNSEELDSFCKTLDLSPK